MKQLSAQAPSAVIMIRPHHFYPNVETAEDNAFQSDAAGLDKTVVAMAAHDEVTHAAEALRSVGVRTHIF